MILINKHFKTFIDSIDYMKLFRRIAFIWVLWLTTTTILWATNFAGMEFPKEMGMDPGGRAMLIGAILGPVAAVQGWVLKIYSEGSMKQQEFNKNAT